jgi:hypothetical protein
MTHSILNESNLGKKFSMKVVLGSVNQITIGEMKIIKTSFNLY